MPETFQLTLELTQEEINELGAAIFSWETDTRDSGEPLHDKLVNAAGAAGADLP